MTEDTKRIIEINGVKMEVDLRYATQVHENIKVGSRVKLLKKEYSTHKVLAGVVVGFENFKELPTIVVAAFDPHGYSQTLTFHYINSQNKDAEIVPALDWYPEYSKQHSVDLFDKDIAKKRAELEDLESKKTFFIEQFEAYFRETMPSLEKQLS